MTPQNFQTYLRTQQLIIESLARIAIALEHMIPPQAAPNYQFELKDYSAFNWASIGAVVADFDSDGATAIIWRNHTYLRRSPTNKFDAAIWFSRCVGKDEKGANIYERLITFKAIAVPEPLPQRITAQQSGR
ncbi:single-stranded DNA-binding protein [Synechocystis sp. PCC 7509]|uniref:single-stranded DNA-binding protein n=1 Tax=Synechocystis sp. PCC 7509 TaxID=927677 RepID=UPI0002ACCD95|nr:single-stranded DNA-binding protein [Synechocystis sp. PCC 7509]